VSSGDASLTLADGGGIVDLTAATDQVVTIPLASSINFPLGTVIKMNALHATARKRWRPVSGVTLRKPEGFGALGRPWGESWIRKIGADEWALGGEILFDVFTLDGAVISLCADWGVTVATGVSQVLDQSTAGNDVAQATGGNQPALVSAWRNGRNAIQGASGKVLVSGNVLAYSAPTTLLVVGEWNTTAAYQALANVSTPDLGFANNSGDPTFTSGTIVSTGGTIANGAAFLGLARASASETSLRVEPNAAVVQTATGAAGSGTLSGQFYWLNHYFAALPYLGKSAAVVGFNRALTVAEEAAALAQLRAEYNIHATGL